MLPNGWVTMKIATLIKATKARDKHAFSTELAKVINKTRCPRQAIILQQQLLILVDLGARYGRMIDSFPEERPGRTFITTLKLTKLDFCNTLICSTAYSNVLHQYVLFMNASKPYLILICLLSTRFNSVLWNVFKSN